MEKNLSAVLFLVNGVLYIQWGGGGGLKVEREKGGRQREMSEDSFKMKKGPRAC